jgi:hypothetical protein
MTEYVWRPPAVNDGWEKVLRDFGFQFRRQVEPFGPMGLRAVIFYASDVGSIIITQAEHDGVEWIHASIAYVDRDPTYLELAALHRAVFGRKRFSYQAFAPESEHVNIHEHALHLWGTVDGARLTPKLEGSI